MDVNKLKAFFKGSLSIIKLEFMDSSLECIVDYLEKEDKDINIFKVTFIGVHYLKYYSVNDPISGYLLDSADFDISILDAAERQKLGVQIDSAIDDSYLIDFFIGPFMQIGFQEVKIEKIESPPSPSM